MLLVSISNCENLQLIRRPFIEVDHLIGQDFEDQRSASGIEISSGSSTTHGSGTHASRSLRFALSLSFSPSTANDYVGVLLMIVLSASGLVAEDAIVAILLFRFTLSFLLLFRGSLRVQALSNVELSLAKLLFTKSGSEWLFMSNHVRPKMYPLLPRQGLHMYASRLAIVDAVAALDAAVLWHVVAVFPQVGRLKVLRLGQLLSSQIVLSCWWFMCFPRVWIFCTKSYPHLSHFPSELVLSHT